MADTMPQEQEHTEHVLSTAAAMRIMCVALAAALVWFRIWEPYPRVSVVGIAGALIGLYPIVKEATENVIERRMTMELSMTIAIFAALAIGQFFTALVIVLFVLIAEVLEGLTVRRGRTAIKDLLDLLPQEANVRRNGRVETVPIEGLQSAEIIEVNPGARIPVDGDVIGGHSFVDQAPITGESLPVEKVAGTTVYAGTINQSGALEIRVTRVGRDTAFGRILETVEAAEHSRAPIQKLADRLAGYLVWFALGSALLTYLITRNLTSTISVVIVAGACGIAAGTPLAILGGIGRAAREGAVIKGGLFLEQLSTVDTVVFDKTGTLTFGIPNVTAVFPSQGHSDRELLTLAAIAEQRSEHPLGKAILSKATALQLPVSSPEQFSYTPGKGIACSQNGRRILVGSRAFLEGNGVTGIPDVARAGVLVASNCAYVGAIAIEDLPRPEARAAVHRLHAMGLDTALLTGDAKPIAEAIARQVGIDAAHAEVLPEQKGEVIDQLIRAGAKVAMVGDGINDAPALMAATVGIAMGSGTDVARESAQIMLIGNDLLRLVDTIAIARRCRRIILFNFAGTLVVDAIGIVLAGAGILNPLFAAFIHVSSELTFILNSARLLPAAGLKKSVAQNGVAASRRGPVPRSWASTSESRH